MARENILIRQLWHLAGEDMAADPKGNASRLYVETLNEMINLQTVRIAALNNRIPGAVLGLEVLGTRSRSDCSRSSPRCSAAARRPLDSLPRS